MTCFASAVRSLTPRLASALSLVLTGVASAQTGVIFNPGQFSGNESLVEFEGLAEGDTVSSQIPGLTFTLTDGGAPWVVTSDGTPRQFAPQNPGLIQNFDPTVGLPPDLPDLDVYFEAPINRVGFEIKNNDQDDLILSLIVFEGGQVIGQQQYNTSFGWRFLGLESDVPFDHIIVDVTDVTNGSFRLDNLRYEFDPTLVVNDDDAPFVNILSPEEDFLTSASTVDLAARIIDGSTTSNFSTPSGLAGNLPQGGGELTGTVPLVEGENEITVTSVDSEGNIGGTSVLVIRDSLQPGIDVVSPPFGSAVASSPVTVTVQITDATATTVQLGPHTFNLLEGGGTVAGDIDLVEGTNSIQIDATDAAGNTITVFHDVVLDLYAPIVTITEPLDGTILGPGQQTVAVSATVDELTSSVITSEPEGVGGTLPAGGGVVTGAVTLVQGSNSIIVTATDETGAIGADTVGVIYDAEGPVAAINSPEDGRAIRGEIEFAGVAADIDLPLGSVEWRIDGQVIDSIPEDPPFSFMTTVDTALLADGWHEFSIAVADSIGNTTIVAVNALVDNTFPVISIDTPQTGSYEAGVMDYVSTSSDATSGLAAQRNLVAGGKPDCPDGNPDCDGSVFFEDPVIGTPVTIFSQHDTEQGGDGGLLLKTVSMDGAGNETFVLAEVTVDNTGPAQALVQPLNGDIVSGTIEIIAGAWDKNFLSLEIFVDGTSVGYWSEPLQDATVVYDTTQRLDGEMAITVVATDLAGNVETTNAFVTVDNIAVVMRPQTLNLRSQKLAKFQVDLWGPNMEQLLPTEDFTLVLHIPGGSPVYALQDIPADDAVGDDDVLLIKFDRQEVIASLRAGVNAGVIDPNRPVTLTFTANGLIQGTDNLILN